MQNTEIDKDKLEEFLRIALDKAKHVLLQGLLGEKLFALEAELHDQTKTVIESGPVWIKILNIIRLLFLSVVTTAMGLLLVWIIVFFIKTMREDPQQLGWLWCIVIALGLMFIYGIFMFSYMAINFFIILVRELVSLFVLDNTDQQKYSNAEYSRWIVEMEINALGELTEVNRSTLKQINKSGLLTIRRGLPDFWYFELGQQFYRLRAPLFFRFESALMTKVRYGLDNFTNLYRSYEQFAIIAAIYEYISSGRCDLLDGEGGAYQLLQQDEKENRIMKDMRKMVADPEPYKERRPVLYQEYMDILENLKQIMDSHKELLEMIGKLDPDEENEELSEEEKEFDEYIGNRAVLGYIQQRSLQELDEQKRLRQMRLLDVKIPQGFVAETLAN